MTQGDYHKEFTPRRPDLPVEVRDKSLDELRREFSAYRKFHAGFFTTDAFISVTSTSSLREFPRRKLKANCSFYRRGECTRGADCPYLHGTEDKTRAPYNVVNVYDNPVPQLLLGKAREKRKLETPEDESIKTLYVGGLNSRVLEQDIRDQFHGYGEIESIRFLAEKVCAVVKYTSRQGADKAAEELRNKLVVVNGQRVKLTRGGPQVPKTYPDGGSSDQQVDVVAHSGLLPRALISQQENQPPPMHPQPPPHQGGPFYPQRMGAVISSQENRGASSSSSSSSYQHFQAPAHPYL